MKKFMKHVNQRIESIENAREENNFLLAGNSLGEIGRIIVWGSLRR